MAGGGRLSMRGRNRGQVLIMFVLALFVLLGFVALGIDVGYMYSVRNDLQRSADSGALAGAYVFNDGHWPEPLQGKARIFATDFATRDPVGDAPLPAGAVTVTFPANNQISVRVDKTVSLFFAGAIGIPTVTLSATAAAEAVKVGQNAGQSAECLKPLAVPLPYIDSSPSNERYDPGGTVYNNCSGPGTLCQGTPMHLRIVNESSISASEVRYNSGRLFQLDICETGSGSSQTGDFQDWIEDRCTQMCPEGDPATVGVGELVQLRDNQSVFLTRGGLQSLISGDNFGVTFDSDLNYPELPQSTNYDDANWINSPRVTRMVLYDPSVVATQNSTSIPVWGFAGFWINSVYSDNCDPYQVCVARNQFGWCIRWETRYRICWYVDGYLIPNSAVGDSSNSIGPFDEPSLKTTRLVQ